MAADHQVKPRGAGKSSFDLIDAEKFFLELNLQPGTTFLDVACGRGAYCLKASQLVGSSGNVYAVDLWEEGIRELKARAAAENLSNIRALVGDAGLHVPVDDQVVEVCLMATVLHDFVEDHIDAAVLREVGRVLKPEGTLAIVEFQKIDGPPGPPRHIRLSPQEVAEKLTGCGFRQKRLTDIGPYTYLMLFKRSE